MESSIFAYIFRHSLKRQIVLLALTLASFPFLYASLDLPKTIVNKAIGAKPADFPKVLLDMTFDHVPYLLILCAAFLALVFINGAFKYAINVFKGRLGESMLRRLRYELYSRVLRFPLPYFRRVSQGELISMITAEVEPLGGFIGDAFAQPLFQGGTLLTILVFMFVQDPILGAAAVALYPVQMVLIPKLQRQVNQLGKQRVRTVRKLSERLGESVSAIQDVHANDTSEYERADISDRLGTIYAIRYDIYQRKFVIKFLNNFFAQVTPFFFYSIGGYLVIVGDLSLGALVAVLAAYKDLSSPWKELLDYYQQTEDARIKYEQLIEQFQPAGGLEASLQRPEPGAVPALAGPIVATNVGLEEEGGIKVLEGATTTLDITRRIAVVGPPGSGRAGFVRVLARLLAPTGGSLAVGGRNLGTFPESTVGRRIAFIDQAAHLASGSIRDNLYYGLKHVPLRPAAYDPAEAKERERFFKAALEAGGTASDINADWIDYAAAGVADAETLHPRAVEVAAMVELEDEIYVFGLQGTLDPAEHGALTAKILEARRLLHRRLDEGAHRDLVEPFDRARYNHNMTVGENLLFGTPVGADFDLERLGENALARAVLEEVGLSAKFLDIGLRLSTMMVELFRDLPPDHEYFERFSFIRADELPDYQRRIQRAESLGVGNLDAEDRNHLISLPFKLIPARHRVGLIDAEIQSRILAARDVFARRLPPELKDAVAFFEADAYNRAASVQDNILFGRLVYGRPQARQQVGALVSEVIQSLALRSALLSLGLDFQVGIGGSRLSVAQRQKVALARCLLKRPDLLIVNDATAALEPAVADRVLDNVLKEFDGRGLIWVLGRADLARKFDRVIVMEGGKVAEQGTFAELDKPGSRLAKLAAAE